MISGFTITGRLPFAKRPRLQHRADLHLGDFRMQNAKPAASATEHRIFLVQRLDALDDVLSRNI